MKEPRFPKPSRMIQTSDLLSLHKANPSYSFDLLDVLLLYLLLDVESDIHAETLCVCDDTYTKIVLSDVFEWFSYYTFYDKVDVAHSLAFLVSQNILSVKEWAENATEYFFCIPDSLFRSLDFCSYHNCKALEEFYANPTTIKHGRNIHTGWLYCFYNSENNLTKLGIADNLLNRKHSLECASGNNLDFIIAAKVVDNRKYEKAVHTYFSEFRKNGEWFALSQENLQDIKRHLQNIAEEEFEVLEWKESL